MDILTVQQPIEQLLSDHLGGPVRLGEGHHLDDRSHVARYPVLDGPPGSPTSLIVKGWRGREGDGYDPETADPRAPSTRLFNDWAGTQFLGDVMGAGSLAPQFYAGSRSLGAFVMENLDPGYNPADAGHNPSDAAHNPADALLGSDPALAEKQMIALAASLGRMHAATIGRKDDYDRIRSGLGPLPASREEELRRRAAGFEGDLAHLGGPLSPAAITDLEQALDTVVHPGPFLAYNHGDPCPDNWFAKDGRLRLFDFERGGYRHALQDGVYGRIHFPTCWCVNRFPPEIPDAMEAAYRAELVKGCPAAADDRLYYPAVVEVCAFWMLQTCVSGMTLPELMEEDSTWGISSVRQRVLLRAGILAGLSARYGHLQALGQAMADLAALLRARWPEEAGQMPVYPAFSDPG